MTVTKTYSRVLVAEDCCNCGITFGMPKDFQQHKIANKTSFYCPNGHAQSYVGQTDSQKAREAEAKALRLERDRDYWMGEERKEREGRVAAEHRERAQKAAKTRLKNRVAKGVCPCCKRHFANVQKHIEGQHPDFAAAPSSSEAGS